MPRPTKSVPMTPAEALSAFDALAKTIGSRTTIHVNLNTAREWRRTQTPALDADVYLNGIGHGRLFTVQADTFDELLVKTSAKWDEMQEKTRADTITRMALAIIKLTDANGACTDAALRAEGFACEDVRNFSDMAVNRAELMGLGPFAVQFGEKSNGAPAAVEDEGDEKPGAAFP